MKRFKKILIGVDLSQGDRLVSDQLNAPTIEAVERGLWLAEINSAQVRFLSVLHVSPHTQHLIEERTPSERCVLDDARDALANLIGQAEARGVRADSLVVFGKPPVEMIRQVLKDAYDLVVVGTRDLGRVRRTLLGCTAVRLLRKCPCPVWVTKPQDGRPIKSILVADDLSEVGQRALELGCSMASLHDAQLHVLHAVSPSDEHLVFPGQPAATDTRLQCETAQRTIEDRLSSHSLPHPPHTHVVEEDADLAILEHIEKFEIELLVMGTLARTGLAGILVGNTAERLLPEIPCSVLAIKPADFESPVRP